MKEIYKLRMQILFTKKFWVWHWNDYKTNMKKSPRQNGLERNPELIHQIMLGAFAFVIALTCILIAVSYLT